MKRNMVGVVKGKLRGKRMGKIELMEKGGVGYGEGIG